MFKRKWKRNVLTIFGLLFFIVLALGSADTSDNSTKSKGDSGNKPTISKSEFNQIRDGMSYTEVQKVVGSAGEILSEAGTGEYKTFIVLYEGEGSFGANANVTFQNDRVVGKAQLGLK